MMDMDNEEKNTTASGIEAGFSQLEQIIKNMEGGNQSLEEAFADYQKGVALVQSLDAELTDIEKKLEIFNKMTGELEEQNE